MMTIELILERNGRLTRAEVLRRAELTPAMLERIAKHRADPAYSIFAQPGETDEQIAMSFVACDAADERDRLKSKHKILVGHISPDTAYVVEDYPYGYKARCKIRYWLEYKDGHGFRLVSQTTNPRKGHVWNKPKASTYMPVAACLILDEQGHVTWVGLSSYTSAAEAMAFKETYGEGVSDEGKKMLDDWIGLKNKYEKYLADKAAKLAAPQVEGGAP